MRSLHRSLFIALCVTATLSVVGCEDHYVSEPLLEDIVAFGFDTSGIVDPDTVDVDTSGLVDADTVDFELLDADTSDFDTSDGDVPCDPVQTCRALGAECGDFVSACGDVVTCGRCGPGTVCDDGIFRCIPDINQRCGNSRLDPGEDCDDGNRDNRDNCTNRCGAATQCNPCMDDAACGTQNVCVNSFCAISCDLNDTATCQRGFTCTQTPLGHLCQSITAECIQQERCAGVTCNSPPPPRCDGDTLSTSLSTGRCDPMNGQCTYDTFTTRCSDQGLACVAGACAPVTSSCVISPIDVILGDAIGNVVFNGTTSTNENRNTESQCLGFNSAPDVSFEWIAPANGCFDINTFGSNFDTILSIKSCVTGDELMCNDDIFNAGSGVESAVSLSATAGQKYVLIIDGYDNRSGNYALNINPCEVCDDGLDNDNDGFIDCEDLSCSDDPRCGGIGEVCDDGFDNNNNGLTDCEDPACFNDPRCMMTGEVCDDGFDNDGNGLTDCEDFACFDDPRCFMGMEVCNDGVDNDGNGLTDCEDFACFNGPLCVMSDEVCNDRIDNDGDRASDCADSQCYAAAACSGATPFFGGAVPSAAIPDADQTGIFSTLTLDTQCVISVISIDVNITHPWRGDLVVDLISPSGTTVHLHNNNGGSAHDIIGNYPNTLQPAGRLRPLIDQPAAGVWTLVVKDTFAADLGTLNSWGLNITCR